MYGRLSYYLLYHRPAHNLIQFKHASMYERGFFTNSDFPIHGPIRQIQHGVLMGAGRKIWEGKISEGFA